ncbi:SNase-domain-containing protein [Rhodofomes roseus]|uniref:SNase-domain-containing protein n=1 Tax=Rhodofomes roseus TaxID=34475 RepID=A0ABQ8KJI5_9APHY|nr:SNase-domain-containing protein [Rhodofomes roseus]KAH9837669.1 SNase-domain-containing protein [Rhodofomes roseus]
MVWPWSPQQTAPSPDKRRTKLVEIDSKLDDTAALIRELKAKTLSLPVDVLLLAAFLAGSASAAGTIGVYRRYWRRLPTADWITPEILVKGRWIKGYVTSVGDADNFRLYHTPGIGWRWPLKFRTIPTTRGDLKDQTIHIRLAGVDAPEAAHFGKPAQEFAQESLAWLKYYIEGRFVYCQLCRKDQYGRIVAHVHWKPRILPGSLATGKSVPIEMLQHGWAEVYEQSGAEHGQLGVDEFLRVQGEAQTAKRGIWKYGLKRESAADYKKRYASGDTSKPVLVKTKDSMDKTEGTTQAEASTQSGGVFRRLFRVMFRRSA